jgi:hypothetical protein
MKFLRQNAGYFLLVHKRNELITDELKKRPQQVTYSSAEEIGCRI